MPQSTTSLDSNVSGTTGATDTSINYVTFDAPYLFTSLDNTGNVWNVPSILFLAGNIHYRIDNQGNVMAEALNPDGTLPI